MNNVKKVLLIIGAIVVGIGLTSCNDEIENNGSLEQARSNTSVFNLSNYSSHTSSMSEQQFVSMFKFLSITSRYVVSYYDVNSGNIIFSTETSRTSLGKKLLQEQKTTNLKDKEKEDIIYFSTTDEDEFNAWQKKMYDDGRIVVSWYDDKTGTYSGQAYTPEAFHRIFG